MTTTKMEKPKAAEERKTAEPAKRDPRLCYCANVQRRWDTDGVPVEVGGINHYPCSKCGKLYSAGDAA